MAKLSGDGWTAGDAYESYMGRWSREVARVFLDWLGPPSQAHWLEVGCGTGALTAAILEHSQPASIVACDPSEPFIEHARRSASEQCSFQVLPSIDALPSRDDGFDVIVSGLVLNFVEEPSRALEIMRQRSGRGGAVAAYIWDYAGGLEFLKHFWAEAVALDPKAASHDESKRFGHWDTAALKALFNGARFAQVETAPLEIPTDFSSFDNYWKPFLGRTGPAPSYVASLEPPQRALLKSRLEKRLGAAQGGAVRLRGRALAVRGIVG